MDFLNFSEPEFKVSPRFLEEKDWEGQEGFMREDDLRPAELRFPLGRVNFLRIAVILGFLILSWRIFSLQVLAGVAFKREAESNRTRAFILTAPRGVIYDQTGKLLVRNIPNFEAVFIPADLPPESEYPALAEKLQFILGLDQAEIIKVFRQAQTHSYDPEGLAKNLTREQALVMDSKLSSLPGVRLISSPIREYLGGEAVSHILGYAGKISREEYAEKKEAGYFLTDYIGKQGVESFYEETLKGSNGREIVEVNVEGQIEKIVEKEAAKPGKDLKLSLDLDLLNKLAAEMQATLAETGAKKAAAVILDPRTGRVLALVSLPFYDNNLFARGISAEDFSRLNQDANLPLFNRAIAGEYPPGSTFKPLIAVAALSENVITSSRVLNCPGKLTYQGWGGTVWNFPDWKAHGSTDLRKAIAESCNVFFYILGGGDEARNIAGLGIDRIKIWSEKFGFNAATGIDLPGEARGLIPDSAWKKEAKGEEWYIGDTYHASIGQGDVLATPLQMANYIATIANGGTLYRPQIGYKIINEAEKSEAEISPVVLAGDLAVREDLEVVRQGMRQTVTEGSGRLLANLPFSAAGKTGTAQFGSSQNTHAWFVGFAPYEEPEIAFAILIEGGGGGEKAAVPIAKNVLEWYFKR